MSPPAPNASTGMPEPTNSLPAGAGTATRMAPGGTMPMSGTAADTGMSGMRPMRGQMHQGAMAGNHGRMMSHQGMAEDAGDTVAAMSPGREYRGGAGSPRSNRASNITTGDTRSDIAPRLPDPAAAASTPEGYLAAAQRSLNAGKTGAAQEALERAETRLLSRSTDPSMAASPADMPMVRQIGEARRALAGRDMAAAKAAISAAMSSGS